MAVNVHFRVEIPVIVQFVAFLDIVLMSISAAG